MYVSSEKVILTDCDGVLLDWLVSFRSWMDSRGYKTVEDKENSYDISEAYGITKSGGSLLVREFNASAWMASLTPFGGAIEYVQRLYREHGYVFHCITSMSTDPKAKELRMMNLENVFGKGIFTQLECLDCGADKDDALEPYRDSDCFWIEDKPENADAGIEMGLRSILIAHPHNAGYTGTASRVANWKGIYDIISL